MQERNMENYSIAHHHFWDYSTGDPTAVLAKEHGLLGLTRIMLCMESLGLDKDDVNLIALPDFTYTKNKLRWASGFPYGCIVSFNEKNPPFIPLDFRPNCCGVILAELDDFEDTPQNLQQKYYDIVQSYTDIDKSDFNRRNHFMGVYYCDSNSKYYFLIHGSFNFVKDALYTERNGELLALSKQANILGAPFSYLLGDEAKEYYQCYLEHEAKTIKYRALIANALFPGARIRFNRTHEGFYNIRTLLLGAYASNIPFSCPIMLAPEENLPLVNVQKPISIPDSNNLYCAPHGGGYMLQAVSGVKRANPSLFADHILIYPNESIMLTDNILDMPFCYRSNTSQYWCNHYHMACEQFSMTPILNLKI